MRRRTGLFIAGTEEQGTGNREQSSTLAADPWVMKLRRMFFLPEGDAIIAQEKRSAVLGQSSIRVSVLEGRCEIRSDALFNEINHLQPRRFVVSF
jgi:hypothetical protein